jgi:hypothetical protein
MITLKIYNKENKDEVWGGEEEGVLENKWMIFHGLIFLLFVAISEVGFFMYIYLSLTICP